MTIREALHHAREALVASEIEDASLEAEVLLRHALKINRVQLFIEFERQLSPLEEQTFQALLARRLKLEPIAYITGQREFYGCDFYVTPDVLIPRPETELLVEKAMEVAQARNISTIADIGTGCGAIAISLALHLPEVKIYATDISVAALEVTRVNCQKYEVCDRVCLLAGDMLEPLPEPVDMMVANLPYVPEAELRGSSTLKFEPSLALNGGTDGMAKIRLLCAHFREKLQLGGCLLLEIGQGQASVVSALLHRRCPSAQVEVTPDLNGIDRVVSLLLPQ